MPKEAKYFFIVSMDVEAKKEDLFNEVYDNEHVPYLYEVPGVVSVTRLEKTHLTMNLGGKRLNIVLEDEPKYTAIYEIAEPEVLVSEAWTEAVERGRWSSEVRPYTTNRRHVLRRVI